MDDVHLGEDLEGKDTGAASCHRYGRVEREKWDDRGVSPSALVETKMGYVLSLSCDEEFLGPCSLSGSGLRVPHTERPPVTAPPTHLLVLGPVGLSHVSLSSPDVYQLPGFTRASTVPGALGGLLALRLQGNALAIVPS